jgi:hypothetical protein
LVPTAAQAGFDETVSQAGAGGRATANYQSADVRVGTGTVAVTVLRTEDAARARYTSRCPECVSGIAGKWKYKWSFQVATDASRNRTVRLVAYCRNLNVETTRAALDNKDSLTNKSRLVIGDIFDKAARLGMTPCGGAAKPPPTAGSYYWTESHAEDVVVTKVRIPYCNLYPADPQCRVLPAQTVVSAQCRGLDEKPGTFTFSRFTCDILAGVGGRFRGRIAVWPTGSTTFRWQII